METKTAIKSNVGELKGLPWLQYWDGDELVTVVEDNEAEAAKALKISPAAVSAIRASLEGMADSIIEELEKDLADIWTLINKNG